MEQRQTKVLDMVYIALGAVLITICSWISIPLTVPFTMQTFAIFAVTGLLGSKRGALSMVVFLLLGSVGVPVFAGFKAGVQVLIGPTGGYLLGFLCLPLLVGLMEKYLGKKTWVMVVAMVIGLVVCYIFGTVWFVVLYLHAGKSIGIMAVLGMCVFPFIIPDLIKLAIAVVLTKRLGRFIR